jgi:XTP/dITP diphosphohydrolase
MKKLLVATTNQGKIAEYAAIFKKLNITLELLTLRDLNIKADLEETGKTFEENAIAKAKFYYNLSKLPTLSDDAGLEIDYLNGEPGVHSRRWPGYAASDEELINIALEKLKGVSKEKRGARLRAVVGLCFPEDKTIYTFEGILKGNIAQRPTGKVISGYPFRSIFIAENSDKHLGQLGIIAHRWQAIEKALPIIKKYLC